MYRNFKEIEKDYMDYWRSDNQKNAIELAEKAYIDFPDSIENIVLDLIIFYGKSGNVEACKNKLREGFSKGHWYPSVYISAFIDNDIYSEEKLIWERMRDDKKPTVKQLKHIRLPKGYKPTEVSPLFISLHGYGEDLELFDEHWKSEVFDKFIHVSLESTIPVGYRHFAWNDRDLAFRQITQTITELKGKHAISNIIIGGFSQGANLAMDYVLHDSKFNLKNFIALNSSSVAGLTDEQIIKKKDMVSGVIITGDLDPYYNDQLEMNERYKDLGLKCEFIVAPGVRHWFPDDLGEKIQYSVSILQNI
jgi:predicted esterase